MLLKNFLICFGIFISRLTISQFTWDCPILYLLCSVITNTVYFNSPKYTNMNVTVYGCIFFNLSAFDTGYDPVLFFFWSNCVPQMSWYLGPWVYNPLASLTTCHLMHKGKDQITIPVTLEFSTEINWTQHKKPQAPKSTFSHFSL